MPQSETSLYTGAFAQPQPPNFSQVSYVDSPEPKLGVFAHTLLC